jgi:3-hydroxybutyrate dehydrogenase
VVRGKTSVVTGSASGIGSAVATTAAARGIKIPANGFGEANAIAAGDKLANFGFAADLQSLPGMLTQATPEFGGVDSRLNNAGIQNTAPAIEGNLSAAMFAARALPAPMLRGNWRRVGNISATHSLAGSVHKAADVAAKHAVLRLTKVVALETVGRWWLVGAIGMRP